MGDESTASDFGLRCYWRLGLVSSLLCRLKMYSACTDVDLPSPCSNEDYERIIKETCKTAVKSGVEYMAFGDLFLSDVREYRERQLRNAGLKPIFPVWGIPMRELAHSMIDGGLKAKLTCVDCKCLPPGVRGPRIR